MMGYLTTKLSDRSARYAWLFLSLFSLFGIIEIPYATVLDQPKWLLWGFIVLIAAFKGCILTILIIATTYKRWTFSISCVLIGSYVFCCLINFFSFISYGFGITHRMVTILSQTNIREIKEFMPDLLNRIFSPESILCIGGTAIACWLCCIIISSIRKQSYLRILYASSLLGFATLTFCLVTFNSRAALIMSVRIPKNIINTIQENKEYQKIAEAKRPLLYSGQVDSPNAPINIIMVIGESAHRLHHQLYDYPLPTTPQLWSMRDSLFIFRDAISSSQGTAGNMERLLSLKTDDKTYGDWYKFPLVYDIFKAARFKTFWLSNQERKGLVSNASGVMADGADVINYVSVESSEDPYAYRYDDALLPSIYDALNDKANKKFIGIHLLGSHSEYRYRYPKEETIFTYEDIVRVLPRPWLDKKKASLIAQYDNSIHFTDKLLGKIILQCRAMLTPTIFLYFPDHGEMVYDTENFKGRNEQCVEVPFVIYANYQFRAKYPDKILKISRAVSLPISTASIPFALLTLADIKYPLYNASHDFLSDYYKIRPRLVDERIWKYETITKTDGKTDK